MLLPCELDAGDMRHAAVSWLPLLEVGKIRVAGRQGSLDLKNRIRQGLVKPSGFDDSDSFQIVLEQEIEVVCMRRFEGRITHRNPVAARFR